MTDPPWAEPTDDWTEREAATLKAEDYILVDQRRFKVLSSYSASAGTSAWYVTVYEPGQPTKRIGCDSSALFLVEVQG